MYYDIEKSGKRIRTLRKEKGITQEDFANRIGMSYKTINAIENGSKGTKIDTLVLMAEELETTLDYIILGRKSDMEISILLSHVSEEKRALAIKILKGILQSIW